MSTEKKLNTTVTLKQNTKPEEEIKAELEKAARASGSKLVEVLIPDVYRAAFGDPAMFSVNGIRVEVPIGVKTQIPEPHAKHIARLMKAAVVNKTQRRLKPEEVYED
jgi:hypothetical protein